ncbi:MAG: hypothetical protein MSS53_02185 [Oscillibacter sp.]|nr:hypothetical protein [Oscillibacter sp.]
MQKQDQEQSSHFLPDYKREHWRKLDKPITISDFINREIPTNWQEWPIEKRRLWWKGDAHLLSTTQTNRRDRIAAIEIWCELYDREREDFRQTNARDINTFLAKLPNLTRGKDPFRFGPYGMQRGFHIG